MSGTERPPERELRGPKSQPAVPTDSECSSNRKGRNGPRRSGLFFILPAAIDDLPLGLDSLRVAHCYGTHAGSRDRLAWPSASTVAAELGWYSLGQPDARRVRRARKALVPTVLMPEGRRLAHGRYCLAFKVAKSRLWGAGDTPSQEDRPLVSNAPPPGSSYPFPLVADAPLTGVEQNHLTAEASASLPRSGSPPPQDRKEQERDKEEGARAFEAYFEKDGHLRQPGSVLTVPLAGAAEPTTPDDEARLSP